MEYLKYLEDIAEELRLIRIELQYENDLLAEEKGLTEQPKEARRDTIAKQLNDMFK